MKNLFTLVFTLLIVSTIFAQAPQKFSYQAVVRNSADELVQSSAVGVKISILEDATTGTVVFEETHTPTTNVNGLISIEIGAGTVVSGDISTIDWGGHSYFIKTEVDPDGGTTYTISGTNQLLSVPYALNAPSDNDWTTGSGTIYNTTDDVGIGTTAPGASLHVNGDLKLVTGSEGADKVLSSDASGNAEWKYALTPVKSGYMSQHIINPGDNYIYYGTALMSITPEQSGVVKIHLTGDFRGDNDVDAFAEVGYQLTLGNTPPDGFAFNKSNYLGKDGLATANGTFYDSWSVVGTYNVVAGITYYIWVGGRDLGSTTGIVLKRTNCVVTLHTDNGL